MAESLDHQIGRISGRMDSIDANFRDLERRIESRLNSMDARAERTEANIKVIHDAVTSAGGGWRALIWAGTVVTALAGFGAWVIHIITGK